MLYPGNILFLGSLININHLFLNDFSTTKHKRIGYLCINKLGNKTILFVENIGLMIIAIVALARYLILDMKNMDSWFVTTSKGNSSVF